MFIIIREHERKQEVGCFFTEIFDGGMSFSFSFFTMTKHTSTFMRKSELLFKYTKKKCTTSEFHSFTGFFICVAREMRTEKNEVHCWCLSGKKSRKAKVHTLQFHYLLKCNVIQWQRMMVVVVVLLHCHNVDFKNTK